MRDWIRNALARSGEDGGHKLSRIHGLAQIHLKPGQQCPDTIRMTPVSGQGDGGQALAQRYAAAHFHSAQTFYHLIAVHVAKRYIAYQYLWPVPGFSGLERF